jgi:DNA-binding MarR family transcriptional regulator
MSLKSLTVRLTKTEIKILACVHLYGGCFRSVNRLAREIDINYSWAWALVQRLEKAGHITVDRAGRDMVISATRQNEEITE